MRRSDRENVNVRARPIRVNDLPKLARSHGRRRGEVKGRRFLWDPLGVMASCFRVSVCLVRH